MVKQKFEYKVVKVHWNLMKNRNKLFPNKLKRNYKKDFYWFYKTLLILMIKI